MRRAVFAAAMFLWMSPVLAVAAGGVGLPIAGATVVGAAVALLIAAPASAVLDARLGAFIGAFRLLPLGLGLAAALAILRIGMSSVFIADVSRAQFSVDPQDAFRLHHSCVSSYAESARFLHAGGHNIYERGLYRGPGDVPRQIGPLRVDPFHYPPPFLLVPQVIRAMAPDFWDFRRLWFALQALSLAAALVGLAAWIGGRAGAVALFGGLLVLTSPHVAFAMQQGNFQITAIPLAVLGFVLLGVGSHAAGGGLLAYAALGKIFPGLLVVPLITGRQWRPVAWVIGLGVAILAVTVTTQGLQPMRDFVSTSLPELSTGAAFPQTESPRTSRVNWSVYGQTVRLRELGLAGLTQRRGLLVTQVYGVGVVLLAAWAGWRRRFDLAHPEQRVALLMLAVGLLGLGSFRSPFVGGLYGVFSTFWLVALFAARASTTRQSVCWLIGLCALAAGVWAIPSPAQPPSLPWVWISGALVTVSMVIHVWAVVAAVRSPSVIVPAPQVPAPAV